MYLPFKNIVWLVSSSFCEWLDKASAIHWVVSNICMVSQVQNFAEHWYFVSKFLLTFCEKKLLQWLRKTFDIQGWRQFFEITRTIYLINERSEQFYILEISVKVIAYRASSIKTNPMWLRVTSLEQLSVADFSGE